MMYYRPGRRRPALVTITLLIVAASLMNVLLGRRLQSGRTIYFGLALLAGMLDAAAITVAVELIDGFDNDTFVLYFPALLAFSLVFRGWWSFWYAVAVTAAYTLISLLTHGNFDATDPADQKSLVMRLAYGPRALTLDVIDTGRGFDPAKATGRGYGLANMRTRLKRAATGRPQQKRPHVHRQGRRRLLHRAEGRHLPLVSASFFLPPLPG